MNIVIVTPEALPGPKHLEFAGHDVWLRSTVSGLRSLPINVLILAPGLSDEQRQVAIEKTRPTNGRAYELTEIPCGQLTPSSPV